MHPDLCHGLHLSSLVDMESWEFPTELDEFLEFCVEEHNGDFDEISREFLEVASGLDEQLAGRAEEAFSAPSLRQRYLQLHPEADGAAGAAGAVAPPSVTATELTEADHEESNDAADAADADVADWKHAQNEDAPSQFSVLTDSLQDRVRRIYNNVQLRLPSAFRDAGSDSEHSADAVSGRHSEASEDGDLKDAAVRLFGSANLGHVVADLSHGAPVGSPDKSQDRDPSGLIARALRGEDESSEDSAVDDFRAMRKAVKESSQQVATDPKKPLVRKLRQAMPAKPKPKPEPKATGFVRLELVESTSEEEDGKNEVSSEDEEISLEQDSHLRVLHRLESSAPTGECPWDVWLQATRSWPQLKTKLNSPDFCRQNGDLCVNFDVELLKKLIQEEKAARAAARQARIDDQENQKNRVNEYIEEAERRREMIKGRIGGFLLAPRSEKLEETLRRSAMSAKAEENSFNPPPRPSTFARLRPSTNGSHGQVGQVDAMNAVKVN